MSHDWKKILIAPSDSIKTALEVIDKEALRVALVVDKDFTLLGVVTDGDIRRGILAGLDLNAEVSLVMNSKPYTAPIETDSSTLIEKMKHLEILSIPLMDGGKLVGLQTLHESLSVTRKDNPVFIMAGGFGTRLRPLTDNCPKPMLKVGGKPMLETVLNGFIYQGFHNFYISTHYLPEQIRDYFKDGSKWGVNITYVHEEEPLGTGGALGLLPESLPELPLILINGDILTNVDFRKLIKFHNDKNADSTICVREYEYQIPYGVIQGNKGKITSMVEKPIQLFHINAGIYVINYDIINKVKLNENIDMPTLLEREISEHSNVMMYPIHEYWLDIGRMEDFQRAQADIVSLGLSNRE